MGDPERITADLDLATPEDIARIASAHLVDTALATAFETAPALRAAVPNDLVVFLLEMRRANRRRNDSLRNQLLEIGRAAADRGLSLVVLKGGAELLDPLHPVPGHRYISDLDLLAPESELGAASEMLRDLGAWEADAAEMKARLHHHLPPFLHETWPAQVELHRQIGPPDPARSLPAGDVLDRSVASGAPGLKLPCRSDRLLHLALHARRFADDRVRNRILLRECNEFHVMTKAFSDRDTDDAASRLATPHARESFDLLKGMSTAIFRPEGWPTLPARTRKAADGALRTYGDPQDQRLGETLRWVLHYGRDFLSDPERRRHFIRELRRPGAARSWIAFHRDRHRRIR